jgi:hypothetical protein
MRPKLLIVGGLLGVAIAILAAMAATLLGDDFAADPPPLAAAPFPTAPSDPLAPNMPVKDSWSKIDPPDEILEEDLKAIGARLGQALMGQVLYNPPLSMLVDETGRIEVRIAPADYAGNIRTGLIGRGIAQVEKIEISSVMRVRLRGSAFKVDPSSGEAQAILPGRMAQWSFDVTPIRAGKQTLELEVSYLVKAGDNSYPSTLPPFRREIDVDVTTWHAVMGAVKEHRELAISTSIGITLGLTGFFLKLWYMERRARKVRAMEAAQVAQRPRRKRRR